MQFHKLRVTAIEKTTRDAVVVSLEACDKSAFRFTQGQYLTFKKEFDGVELRRSYSICVEKDASVLQVGIKRVNGGVFSTWANNELTVGDSMESLIPMGNFYDPNTTVSQDSSTLLFAAGSGITPILSILRTALSTESTSRYTLVYGNRNSNTIMFREEIENLKNEHLQRLNVIHLFSEQTQDIELFQGRIDVEKCQALFESWIDVARFDRAFICGPTSMMTAVSESLMGRGMASEAIRFELFGAKQPGRAKVAAESSSDNAAGIPCSVRLGGETKSVEMRRDQNLLDAALDNAIDAPYACRAGVCSTCKAKVTKGQVDMISNHALEDHEVEDGFVLTCQSYPVSDSVEFDYDQAGH